MYILFFYVDYRLTPKDKERIRLLQIVSKKGLKELSLVEIKKLQILVENKDYSYNKKANKSKSKLLAKINVAIYEAEEGRSGI